MPQIHAGDQDLGGCSRLKREPRRNRRRLPLNDTLFPTTRGAQPQAVLFGGGLAGPPSIAAPVQFGISHRAIARKRNPKFESTPPVALRQGEE